MKDIQNKILAFFRELILIILGVFLAFQVNVWNENRKSKNEIKVLLKGLVEDLKGDSLRLHMLIYDYEQTLRNNLKMQDGLKNKQIIQLEYPPNFLSISQINIRNTTYNEMVSSGKIHIIEDDSLRNRIIEYYRELERNNYYTSSREKAIQKARHDTGLLKYRKLLMETIKTKEAINIDTQLFEESESYMALQNLLLISYLENFESLKSFRRISESNHRLKGQLNKITK